ncbi:MAG: hypothetical protein J6M31_00050 [Bacteroidales bacterium]|nr:hypothetical protein [Bacteroidales bacterium]
MRKLLHIALLLLLGLSLLAGCRREPVQEEPMSEVRQVTGNPVNVSLTLDIRGFGSDGVITKADYEDVDAALRYDYEKNVSNYGIFVFDATEAYKDDGSGKYTFDPIKAKRLSSDEEAIAHKEQLGVLSWRHELKLNKTYRSLAVLVLANLGTAAYTDAGIPGEGSTLKDVADYFNNTPIAVTYEADQSKYLSGEVRFPMYGFQVFGSWEGLSTGATADEKNAVELKYYSGMATPLTVKGFRTQAELDNYFSSGAVRAVDRLSLRFTLARLHVRYEPAAGQPAATPAPGKASAEITGVKLKNYDSYVRVLPPIFSGMKEVSPFTDVPAALSLNTTGEITFVHPKAGDDSWVAYVPEIKVSGVANDPKLMVDVTVTDKDGNKVYYTFDRDRIRRWDTLGNDKIYDNSPWTEWLQMQTYYTNLLDTYPKKYPDSTTDIPLLTYYNLVRNYSYEWVAYGVEGMKL